MKKKAVPEWLNSSLWSTPLPSSTAPDDLLHRYSSSNPYIDDEVDTPPPPPQPQPPPAPATTRRQVHDGEAGRLGYYDQDEEVPSVEEISRQALLLTEVREIKFHIEDLSKKIINIGELRRLASLGVPDNAGVRPTVWKLLLGYLPPERGLWASELVKKRFQYKNLRTELLMNPDPLLIDFAPPLRLKGLTCVIVSMKFVLFFKRDEIIWFLNLKACKSEITRRLEESICSDSKEPKGQPSGMLKRSQIAHGEHPLSRGRSSIWNKFFQEAEILEQIDRDVKRTHPDIIFFSGDSAYAKSNQDALRNILILFSKLNPGIRYVQGMNEVLAPLFYVFKNDPDEENAAAAEADTFFCFTEIMSGFRDNFCQQLDNSNMGIRSTIARLSQLLKEHDEELWRHLEITTKVNPQFYAFRWITLLLTMEFNFFDILHIWDTLLSDPEGPQETLLRVCCAMLILVRRHLIAGDFTSNLKLLQHYPPTNINHLIYIASKLRTKPLV